VTDCFALLLWNPFHLQCWGVPTTYSNTISPWRRQTTQLTRKMYGVGRGVAGMLLMDRIEAEGIRCSLRQITLATSYFLRKLKLFYLSSTLPASYYTSSWSHPSQPARCKAVEHYSLLSHWRNSSTTPRSTTVRRQTPFYTTTSGHGHIICIIVALRLRRRSG